MIRLNMIRLTIYRLNETIETSITNAMAFSLVSNKVVSYAYKDEVIRIRPYYRRTIDGVLNIFAEEEL